jgi:mevalonate kinase
MIEGYKQLLNSIELHRHLRDSAEIQYNYNLNIMNSNAPRELSGMQYSDMPKGSKNYKDIAYIVADLQKYKHMYEIEDNILKQLEEHKKVIDECINQSDITVKVAQLRAMGLTQEQVGELINISDRHVRRIEAKLRER